MFQGLVVRVLVSCMTELQKLLLSALQYSLVLAQNEVPSSVQTRYIKVHKGK